ncbi:Vps62-related protein [Labedaea rhizosphaerae]|uniref:Uncharacterized protein DUF946 n=1 Tax=Labedaea rhizosphaerae TaxID=598644 RepID=A0A4R6SG25_LABRH|nr:Vps62-related protein [Labedaea rhizosphaerae]TDQ00470.1 uncharacterized protein DUF946 [Labedaea rhizosphaerae]
MGRGRVVAGLVSLLVLAVSGCKTTETGTPQPTGGVTGGPAAFAPLVYLAHDEDHEPGDASEFIRRSTLKWSHAEPCKDETIAVHPAEKDLATPGKFQARKANKDTCKPEGPVYTTTQATRPYSGDFGREGFFLTSDVDNNGEGGPDPVYLQDVPGDGENKGLTGHVYWFFYPWNESTVPGGGHGGNHEGDWERITVVTRGDQPVRVVYSQHDTKCAVDWADVEKQDGHPVVYAAEGSHGSYPKPGGYSIPKVPFPDHADRGKQWRTWEQVRAVEKQPWWGYGGGWGDVGAPIEIGELGKHQTGPAGPMPPEVRDMRPEVFRTAPCPAPLEPTATPGPAPTGQDQEPTAVSPEKYHHRVGSLDFYFFTSPDDQYSCAIVAEQALCQGGTKPVPPRPASCNPDITWGYGMSVGSDDKVDFICAGGIMYGPADRSPGPQDRLPSGKTLTTLGFTCAATGDSELRCTHDASGHGFRIAPDSNEKF